jgi:phosphoribosylaminoimidazole-succinocarboxamide synthase
LSDTLLTYKKIIVQSPGHTVYEGENPGQLVHFFSDTWHSAATEKTTEIHGKGAFSQRISAFLFSKLTQMGIPNHFLGTRNMRESLVQDTYALPFTLRIHSCASMDLSKDFDIPEHTIFDPPLVEYIAPSSQYHINDDFLMAMGWLDQDEIDEIHALALRTAHGLQGLFAAWDLALIQLKLTLARSFESPFVVAGSLAPDHFLVKDLRSGETWSTIPDPESESAPLTVYSALARRLGVYTSASGECAGAPTVNTADTMADNAAQTNTDNTMPNPQVNPDPNSPQNDEHWPKNVLLFPLTRP